MEVEKLLNLDYNELQNTCTPFFCHIIAKTFLFKW